MKRHFWGLALVLSVTTAFLLAKDFWEKPFSEWKEQEVRKMLTDSPWADQHVFTRTLISEFQSSGVGGEKELFDAYTVRFFTAIPIRQAYVRMLQLNHKYDEMVPEQKEQFDTQTSGFLSGESPDIVVALDFASNDQSMSMQIQRTLQYQTTDQLKQLVYLFTDSAGQIPVKQYFAPGQDGTGAKFIFPRTIDGKPVVTPQDKEVKFEFEVPNSQSTGSEVSAPHRIFITWKVKDMMYQGQLAL
ncbi:MAG: hypothetical protein ACRD1R_00935 [Acidobacteriota bacterium]